MFILDYMTRPVEFGEILCCCEGKRLHKQPSMIASSCVLKMIHGHILRH